MLSSRPGSGEAANLCMLHAKLWPQSVYQPLAGLQSVKRCAVLPGKARWAVHSRAGQRGGCCSRPSRQSQLWFLLGLARFVASYTASTVLLGVALGRLSAHTTPCV